MSEYQYVGFRAIDAPVSGKDLEFMRRQSSRAEVTPRSFDNEYHFGDFHGDAKAMLRRGYDFHLHYANFGVRTVMIRLPAGLANAAAAKPYFERDSLHFIKDKVEEGGILILAPSNESGDLEEVWDAADVLDSLLPLREEIIGGDLRPLYLAHLAIMSDMNHDPSEEGEGPVPAGLGELSEAQKALAEFFGLDDSLIAAAAGNSPPLPKAGGAGNRHAAWIAKQSEAIKNDWLVRLVTDSDAMVRREMLAEFHASQAKSAWPTVASSRTASELQSAGEQIEKERLRQRAEANTRKRAKKLADIAKDPQFVLKCLPELMDQGGAAAYSTIADHLADLREALAGTGQSALAEEQASRLRNEFPQRRGLLSALRQGGFVLGKK